MQKMVPPVWHVVELVGKHSCSAPPPRSAYRDSHGPNDDAVLGCVDVLSSWQSSATQLALASDSVQCAVRSSTSNVPALTHAPALTLVEYTAGESAPPSEYVLSAYTRLAVAVHSPSGLAHEALFADARPAALIFCSV